MKCLGATLYRRARHGDAEGGFSLIEVMVAVLIIMIGAAALAAVLTQTVAAVSMSRQSQQASNLAEATLAEIEALPWTTGSGLPNSGDANYGLTSSDVTSDTNLTSDGSGGYCFEGMNVIVQGLAGTGTCSSTWQWANVASSQSCQGSLMSLTSITNGSAPLYPHVTCVVINGTDFNISVYPTKVGSGGASSVNLEVEFTVVVSWDGTGATSLDGTDTRVSDTLIACGPPSGSHTRTC